jgi:SecD/SecF fusion protein
MAMFGFTLTLPGIAGIILTIGMAVDANVLIYERLREEMAGGKSLPAAIQAAYEKAFSAIFDANVTTLITSLILCGVADGPVRGFAITLIIGIVGTLFAGLLVTRVMFNWAIHLKLLKTLSFMKILPDVRADFLGKARIAFAVSGVLIAICIGGAIWKGDRAVGVDFRGGDLITLKSARDFSIAQVETALEGAQLSEKALVQKQTSLIDGEHIISVRMGNSGTEATFGQMDRATAALEAGLQLEAGEYDLQRTTIGSVVGVQMMKWSTYALVLGMLGIFLYLCFRFEFAFALGTIVALVHDVVVAIGVVILVGQEVSLVHIGAFLTIAGYSVNDTIVIFDRVREELRTKRGSVQDIMNAAIGITMRRTVLTSLTVLIPMVTLYIFGGPALKDFSFTILVGLFAGTYSTIFIAAPVVLWWTRMRRTSLRREVLDSEQAMVATAGQAKS